MPLRGGKRADDGVGLTEYTAEVTVDYCTEPEDPEHNFGNGRVSFATRNWVNILWIHTGSFLEGGAGRGFEPTQRPRN